MHSFRNRAIQAIAGMVSALLLAVHPVAAGDTILSNNSGVENAVFFVQGEPSLVINGFDLTPLAVPLPVALDAVSISVQTPVPGSAIELVVYQDGNGGSPIDSTLVYRQQVQLNQSGINRVVLAEPAIITEPVVWVGFYLPVSFRFYADQSGSSVLTYWAWTPGGAFDVSSLANAAVLGPGDGTEPVGIAMGGVARITAELRTAEYEELVDGIPLGRQILPDVMQDTSIMQPYGACESLLFDPEDITISADSSFTLDCYVVGGFDAPALVQHPEGQTLDLQRGGTLYKLRAEIPPALHVHGAVNHLPVPVTHCLRIPPGDLERAVIGEAHFVPEKWVILPSVRFGDLVCAEVTVENYISYFIPRTEESPPNVNLVVGWTKIDPHPLECGLPSSVQVPIVNTGQSWFKTDSGHIAVTVRIYHVGINSLLAERELRVNTDQFGPGMRRLIDLSPIKVETFVNELHRLEVHVDTDNEIAETNELDNVWSTEYSLIYPEGYDKCATELACIVEIDEDDDQIEIVYAPFCEVGVKSSGAWDVEEEPPFTVSGKQYRFLDGEEELGDRDDVCKIRIDIRESGFEFKVRYAISRNPDGKCGTLRHRIEPEDNEIEIVCDTC